MSSSNPFRRDQPTDRIESSAASVASEAPQVASLDFSSKPSSTGISPPPQSPSSLPARPHPPFPVQRQQSDHDDSTGLGYLSSGSRQVVTGVPDPFDAISSSGDEGQSTDTERMSESVDSIRAAPSMPPNPFTRTLATIEEPWRSSPSQNHAYEEVESSQRNRRMPRASMDVNAFKNLLMTGKATVDVPPRTKAPSITLADNSSSTDTSSISRQSPSEPPYEIGLETPRTSYEQSISEIGDESTHLLQGSQKHDRARPLPPKHRYGKAVAPQGPQIVSFADFNPSFKSSSPSSVPIVFSSASPTSPTRTDLNKPLPLPPRPSSRDSASIDNDVLSPRRSLDTSEVTENVPPKKIPPTIPLARRARSLTLSRTSSLRSPPPVPAARNRSLSQLSSPSSSSLSSGIISPPPPPPPRRSVNRRSSKGSIEMSSPLGSRRVSQEVGRSSFDSDHRRGSMGSILKEYSITEEVGKSEAEAGTPAPPPLPQESTQAQSQQTKDILADMEAFQREIDELKKKFEDGR
ncbi:hypothetical protein Vi05172_g5933 [Venturia inaequalis]|nr:hypothetical protein Vi05172_g5933 [Venturia inaequalis]